MKISREHFIAMENALHDHLRDAISLSLTNYNYGLLPPPDGDSQSLEFSFTFDATTKEVSLKLLQCWAVTAGGSRIDVKKSSFLSREEGATQPQLRYSTDSFHTLVYDIVVVVNPFERTDVGQPDPEERPLRNPHVIPKYSLEIIPYPRTNQAEQSAYQLTIGRMEIEAGQPKLISQYVPPATSLASHPYLISLNNKISEFLDELEATTVRIIRRKKQQSLSALDADVVYVAEKVAFLLAGLKDEYKQRSSGQPPLYLVESGLKLARTLYTALECCSNKYELLDFYCNWLDWNPGRFENALSNVLKTNYKHEEMFESLKKAEECYQLLTAFFNQIWEMSLPVQVKAKKSIVYGWLVDHTKGIQQEDSSYFTIHQQHVLLGRGAEKEIDINLQADKYISRHHAKIEVEEDNFFLTDLGSSHGTLVLNNKKEWIRVGKEGYYLMDGDTLQLGKTHLVLKAKAPGISQEEAIASVARLPYASLYEFEAISS